jgi:hypothetical protein
MSIDRRIEELGVETELDQTQRKGSADTQTLGWIQVFGSKNLGRKTISDAIHQSRSVGYICCGIAFKQWHPP